jgi:hypothetical protein
MRLSLKSPINYDTIQIKNGTIEKYLAEYRFSLDYATLKNLRQYSLPSHPPKLAHILRVVGSHATLWIGTFQGIVAPMDVQPTGWTYPSGKAFEPENFWQWVPDSRSERELISESNAFLIDPMQPLFGSNGGVFKSLVPYQLAERQGKTLAVDAIPIQRLASIVRKDIDWVFEFDQPTS